MLIDHTSMRKHRERGAALLITVFFFFAISTAVVIGFTPAIKRQLNTVSTYLDSKNAYFAAEAGIEDVLYRIRAELSVSGTETITMNGATATIAVSQPDAETYEIRSTGVADAFYRKIDMEVTKNVNASFDYAVQMGQGGITMGNNARIDATGFNSGNVYASGPVLGSAGAVIDGNVTVSSGINADNVASSTLCETDQRMGQSSPSIDFAQSFIAGSSTPLGKVSIYLKRTGSPVDPTIRIVADNSGSPATAALASQSLNSALVSTSYTWVNIIFSSPPVLTEGVTYWLVFDGGQHNAKYWDWCRSSADAYAGGSAKYKADWSTAGAWTDITGDLNFRNYFGLGESQLDDVSVLGTAKADTITDSTISVDAHYQLISGSSVSGTSFPGSQTPPTVPMPLSTTTIDRWKEDAEDGGTIAGDLLIDGITTSLGPKLITGDLTLDNNATLNVTGTIYVLGEIVLSNNGTIRCDPTYGARSCVIITDSAIEVGNNMTFSGSGLAGSFLMFLSEMTGCLGTSGGAGCATGNSAINVNNNSANAIYYATDSAINIAQNVIVTAVIGLRLQLENNAQIVYDPLIADLTFAPNATSSVSVWTVDTWREAE